VIVKTNSDAKGTPILTKLKKNVKVMGENNLCPKV
jgi:hypothetical protein